MRIGFYNNLKNHSKMAEWDTVTYVHSTNLIQSDSIPVKLNIFAWRHI